MADTKTRTPFVGERRVWVLPDEVADFKGTVGQVKERIAETVRQRYYGETTGKGLVELLPKKGRHVKTYEVDVVVSVRLRRSPDNDFLLPSRKDG